MPPRRVERIGGFHALVDHLADDNVLGRRVAGLGLRVVWLRPAPADDGAGKPDFTRAPT